MSTPPLRSARQAPACRYEYATRFHWTETRKLMVAVYDCTCRAGRARARFCIPAGLPQTPRLLELACRAASSAWGIAELAASARPLSRDPWHYVDQRARPVHRAVQGLTKALEKAVVIQ